MSESESQIIVRPELTFGVEQLASDIADGLGDKSEAETVRLFSELVEALDSEIGTWSFSLAFVRRMLRICLEFAQENHDAKLVKMVIDLSDALGSELLGMGVRDDDK